MFKQTESIFPNDIQHYGCYFFCLLRMCELEGNKEFTKEQIIKLYDDCKNQGWISSQCSVVKPDMVTRSGLFVFGTMKTILQVGELKNDMLSFWRWANKNPYNNPKYIALKFKSNGEIGHHFVLSDSNRNILFDSYTKDLTKNKLLGGLLHYAG